ncbi:protein-methionine-sulfoxide reductase heme-binding subunit MsrQ [Amaricoccus tamworthensis]|uniref:protein-methionine-sulfoxide reductase heme-binding subunit MsrQ n=1 Tax=Amaricoccus tamworthensis TaxID=57002 RepID=UPI003C7BFEA3
MNVVDRVNGVIRKIPLWSVYLGSIVPFIWYATLAVQNRLGADPVKVLEHEFGLIALQLLVAALAVTPLRELLRVNFLRLRRLMGQMAFVYAVLHVLVWAVLDRQLDWSAIIADLYKRPYIILGAGAFLCLVPLAATSFDVAVRRMGGMAWRKLHRLAYPATALAALHFLWLVKAWPPEPIMYCLIVGLLLVYRVFRGRIRNALRPV